MKYRLIALLLLLSTVTSAQTYRDTLKHLKSAVFPLSTLEAGNSFDDLKPLKKLTRHKRIISMGEASHGTSEFFRMKHRMLEFLVKEMGFTLFGIEANFGSCLPINEYVLTGKGDIKATLRSIYAPFWNTQEVLDMIEWMKVYNETAAPEKKVKFYGFDMQQGYEVRKALEAYFRVADPAYFARLDTLPLMSEEQRMTQVTDTTLVSTFKQQLEDHREEYIAATSLKDWQLARQYVTLLYQQNSGFSIYFSGSTTVEQRKKSIRLRDGYMAENVKWILDFEGKDSKIMLWAHNGHVSEGGDPDYQENSMGAKLKAIYGESLYTIGFDFGVGDFNSLHFMSERMRTYTVPPVTPQSFGARFRELGDSPVLLDFGRASSSKLLGKWLREPQLIRDLGATYNPQFANRSFIRCILPDSFDAIIFVPKGTASKSFEF